MNPRVFFDLSISEHTMGKIVMELFAVCIPITTENFLALCTREKGISTTGKPLYYKGTTLHCVVPGYKSHGEDITHKNGTSGESIYGPSFADKNFVNKNIDPGVMSTAKTDTEAKGPSSSSVPARPSGLIASKSFSVRRSKDLTS
ncbi:hypothetical protein Ddye_012877 [Dipteronia dyeriana]|uniref:PPIase cyclophilin-type domain-containing protein n=1 Tax=Dipteronia dyeriana TaxID=168575 RepID=A0AAE0CJ30_9ROSI|nr:hypothetical protein Ddye_012877 [Dipteronia dyeriana]